MPAAGAKQPVVVASGGALSTTATAERIAEVGSFTGWTSSVSPTSNGATVTFIQQVPAATVGSFSFSSSGGAAGTFATVQAGAANDDTTAFVARSAWNVDPMDGTGPSGITLDPTKLNVYEVIIPYLGAGTIIWRVMEPSGHFATVHRVEYPNSATTPSQRNPTYRVGWFAASLGSTTNLTVTGASAAAFVDGEPTSARDPFSTSNLNFTAGTTEYVALALRVRRAPDSPATSSRAARRRRTAPAGRPGRAARSRRSASRRGGRPSATTRLGAPCNSRRRSSASRTCGGRCGYVRTTCGPTAPPRPGARSSTRWATTPSRWSLR